MAGSLLYDTRMNIRACGCIPFMHSSERELVALMILRKGGFWEFPKGKQEEGESDEVTARRELKEETGLTGDLAVDAPIDITYSFTRDGTYTEKTVRYFLCRVPDGSVAKIDRSEANDSAWLSLEELSLRATYPEMKEAARKACELLAD